MYVLDVSDLDLPVGVVHHVTASFAPDCPAVIYVNGQRMRRVDES